MIKDTGVANPPNQDVFDLIDRVCLNAGDIFVYLEGNVLSVADRCFRYALGDEVFDEMGTNNISEAQNSRFDKFVGTSIRVGSVAELVSLCIAYLASAGNFYLCHEPKPGAQASQQKRPDPSVSMPNPMLHIGKMLSTQRKLKEKQTHDIWQGQDIDD
jgi:hypothetical protein